MIKKIMSLRKLKIKRLLDTTVLITELLDNNAILNNKSNGFFYHKPENSSWNMNSINSISHFMSALL